MGKKVHYKLHKVKKQWVTIAVTSAALASIVGGAAVTNQKVSADETTKPVPSTTAESDVVVETHEVGATNAASNTSHCSNSDRYDAYSSRTTKIWCNGKRRNSSTLFGQHQTS